MCTTNSDWNGTWYRPYIKNDMHELGVRSDLGEWPYVFDHVFDQQIKDVDIDAVAEMFESGVITDVKLIVNDNTVRIWQF